MIKSNIQEAQQMLAESRHTVWLIRPQCPREHAQARGSPQLTKGM